MALYKLEVRDYFLRKSCSLVYAGNNPITELFANQLLFKQSGMAIEKTTYHKISRLVNLKKKNTYKI